MQSKMLPKFPLHLPDVLRSRKCMPCYDDTLLWSCLCLLQPKGCCMLRQFNCVQLCVTLWTVVYQAPLSMGLILQARILEWVAISSSRDSSQPRAQTRLSCIGRWAPYHSATWEVPCFLVLYLKSQQQTQGIYCLLLLDFHVIVFILA